MDEHAEAVMHEPVDVALDGSWGGNGSHGGTFLKNVVVN